MADVFARDLHNVPLFRDVKIYYNYILNMDEYQQLDYITEMKYNVSRNMQVVYAPVVHKDEHTRPIVSDDELPNVCRIGDDFIRPDQAFDWNAAPGNTATNLEQ
jgi:hypothetical protein